MDEELTNDGVTGWWLAARQVRPDLSFGTLVGLTAAPARVAACSGACQCRDRAETGPTLADGVRRAGLTAIELAPEQLDRRGPGARGYWPAAFFAPCCEGAILGADPSGSGLSARVVSPHGTAEVAAEPAVLHAARVFRVRATRGGLGPPGRRLTDALLEWVSHSWRPARPGGCAREPAATSAVGLAAYDLWADHLRGAGWRQRGVRKVAAQRAATWLSLRRAGAAFLREAAGARQRPFAVRLGRAADLAEHEVQIHLEPLLAMLRAGRTRGRMSVGSSDEAAAHLQAASELARESVQLIAEAALMRLGVDPAVRGLLLEPPDEPLVGAPLHETVYLARASVQPLRQFAARRLAGSEDRQAVATLGQLLWDAHVPTAETAGWALESIGTDDAARTMRAFERAHEENRT